jgi:hypothetical protein
MSEDPSAINNERTNSIDSDEPIIILNPTQYTM